MNKENLINLIMKECEKDGEPVTREEAEKMAEMELKDAQNRRYEKSNKPRKPKQIERKIDEDKARLLKNCKVLIEGMGATNTELLTETELKFTFNDNNYSFKLIKHRKE